MKCISCIYSDQINFVARKREGFIMTIPPFYTHWIRFHAMFPGHILPITMKFSIFHSKRLIDQEYYYKRWQESFTINVSLMVKSIEVKISPQLQELSKICLIISDRSEFWQFHVLIARWTLFWCKLMSKVYLISIRDMLWVLFTCAK